MTSLQSKQFAVFVCVGVISAFVDVGVMVILLQAEAFIWMATSVGFVCGLLVNFVLHTRWTFRTKPAWQSGWKYLSIVVLNYALTSLCVLGASFLRLDPVAGKLISLPIVAVNTFLLSKYWAFR